MSTLAALRKVAELDHAARARYWAQVDSLAPWHHAAGSYGPDAVSYPMRRAAWRLLILAGAL